MPTHGPRRIAILGGFGFDNLGDDLILRAALRQLRTTLKDVEIILHSNNPQITAARHTGEAVIFSVEALARQVILRFLSRVSKSHRRYLLPIPADAFRRLGLSIRDSDIILSIGGGYLNDYSKFLTHFRLAELVFIGLCRKPIVIYGQEIGPLKRLSLRILARLALKFVTRAIVRDEETARVVSGLGFPAERVSLTADESWTYDPRSELKLRTHAGYESTSALVVVVNIMPSQIVANAIRSTCKTDLDATHLNDQILSSTVACLRPLAGRVRRVVFLSMSSQDTTIGLRLKAMMGGRVPCEVLTDLDSQYAALARARVLIGMRMHSIIMAAQMNVPAIAIALLPKVSRTMDELGSREHNVEGFPFDPVRLQTAFNHLVQCKDEEIDRMIAGVRKRAEELKQRAALNAKIVESVLALQSMP